MTSTAMNRRHQRMARKREALRRSLNPCPGRSQRERMYTLYNLKAIAGRLQYWLNETRGKELAWLPPISLGNHDEQFFIDNREYLETSEKDEFFFVEDLRNPQQKATNRIRVATWYGNEIDQHYMIARIIVSPLPCETWGALPLTRSMWNRVVLEMIESHIWWQWLRAVRNHWSDETFEPGGCLGWWMEPTVKLNEGSGDLCTGQAIYSHIREKFSP